MDGTGQARTHVIVAIDSFLDSIWRWGLHPISARVNPADKSAGQVAIEGVTQQIEFSI